MRKVAFVLVSLTCMCHGRLLRVLDDRPESHKFSKVDEFSQSSQLLDKLAQVSRIRNRKGTQHRGNMLARTLMLFNSVVSSKPSVPLACRTHSCTGPRHALLTRRLHPRHVSMIDPINVAGLDQGLAIRDWTGAAVSFFESLRVPAAVIAATALKDAFILHKIPDIEDQVRDSSAWTLLRYTYMMLMLLSFGSEMVVLYMSTHVTMQLAGGTLNGLGTSLLAFMRREIELEYVTVRLHFHIGLLAHVLAVSLRTRYALRRYPWFSAASSIAICTVASAMMSYNNAHGILYGGFPGLFRRFLRLAHDKFLSVSVSSWERPLVPITVALVAISFSAFCYQIFFVGPRKVEIESNSTVSMDISSAIPL